MLHIHVLFVEADGGQGQGGQCGAPSQEHGELAAPGLMSGSRGAGHCFRYYDSSTLETIRIISLPFITGLS